MPLSGAVLGLFARELAESGLCRKGAVPPLPRALAVSLTPQGGCRGCGAGCGVGYGVSLPCSAPGSGVPPLGAPSLAASSSWLHRILEAGEDLQDDQVQTSHTQLNHTTKCVISVLFEQLQAALAVLAAPCWGGLAVRWEPSTPSGPSRAPEGVPRCCLLADPRILHHILC